MALQTEIFLSVLLQSEAFKVKYQKRRNAYILLGSQTMAQDYYYSLWTLE